MPLVQIDHNPTLVRMPALQQFTGYVHASAGAAPLLRPVDECVLAGVRIIVQDFLKVLQQLRQAGMAQVGQHLPSQARGKSCIGMRHGS